MPGTPLPPVTDAKVQALDPTALSAYYVCLKFESDLAIPEDVRFARLLGYLLLCSPTLAVRTEVANCIHSYMENNEFREFGAFFERHVIIAFKKFKGRTPTPTSSPTRPSFEGTRSRMIEITEAPKTHTNAKEQALIRDNWCCVITGMLHDDAPLEVAAACDCNIYRTATECAHIIPEATLFGAEPEETDSRMLAYSDSVLAILSQFNHSISSFNGAKIHSLANVMTMDKVLHHAFGRLRLYFEATEVPHRYKVKTYVNYNLFQHEVVTFSTPDAEKLPLPSPDLLALHAACCQVAHLSGSSEHIDNVYKEADNIGVLENDGASKDLLHYMLLPLTSK